MAKILTFAILLLACYADSFGQSHMELPRDGNMVLQDWKFKKGDDPAWASKDLDDSDWETVNIARKLDPDISGTLVWLRSEIVSGPNDDSLFALLITQYGASEIYLNGRMVSNLGVVTTTGEPENYNPHNKPIPISLGKGSNLLAIRLAPDFPRSKWVNMRTPGPHLQVSLKQLNEALMEWEDNSRSVRFNFGTRLISAVFALLFLMLFIFFPKEILYLYYGLFNLFLMLVNVVITVQETAQYSLTSGAFLNSASNLLSKLIGMSVLLFILHALSRMRPIFWWYVGLTLLVDFPLTQILPPGYMLISNGFRSLIFVICAWLAYHAFRSEKKENILVGILAFTVMFVNVRLTLINIFDVKPGPLFNILPPILTTVSIVLYLALRNRNVHRDLAHQLIQVQRLSDENLRKEQEKQQILHTQNEKLEQQVQERTASLSQQKQELQSTLAELKATQAQLVHSEKMASLGELTAGIAHEIQNPLNFVNNFSEINSELSEEIIDAAVNGKLEDVRTLASDIKRNQQKIMEHGKRADGIVKNMLQHSRISTGAKEPTDLNRLAEEYLRLAYYGFHAKDKTFNATIKTEFDPDLPQIPVVAQDIGRVLLNLFNNALYAVKERKNKDEDGFVPKIAFSTHLKDHSVILRVSDNGDGIPGEIKDKIFQPFFTTKPSGQGSGLGLSLSYDIVKAHGGELVVESTEGAGALFIVTLPRGSSNGETNKARKNE